MVAALAGHGPGAPDEPLFPGILQGGDVLWVAVDYPQLTTVLWREELVPRFGNVSWATLNANEHTLSVHGMGTLFLRSSEALRGVRGMGKNLRGVIIDEAAHFDLEGALLNEVIPTLLDNRGWLIVMSTTNAGPDGNKDKRVPSFFNMLCEAIRERDPKYADWQEFYGTAYDNPVIDDAAIDELVSLYPAGSPSLDQEVYAKLLRAGVGVALDQLDDAKHFVPPHTIPSHWQQFGSFDWGFNHPYSFGWYACDEDGNIVKVDTISGRKEQPDEFAAKIEAAVPIDRLAWIVGGHDLKNDSKARGETGPTIKERLIRRGWKMIDAKISRVSGLNNLRLYLQWQATEHTPETSPRFRMMDTAGNRECFTTLARMQIDPDNIEDALKVDADAGGKGGDDSYDETRYALMSRPFVPKPRIIQAPREPDRAPMIDYARGKPGKHLTGQQELQRELARRESPITQRVPIRHKVGR
jgi:hypothetical protein